MIGSSWRLLRCRVSAGVGYLSLAGPQRFNTLHSDCIAELKEALVDLEDRAEVGCIVISGYPGESFAVGASITEMVGFSPLDAMQFADQGKALFDQIENSAKPVIAALNGITMGGGYDLALACDIRLASEDFVMAHPGVKIGIITGFGGTQKLPRLIGAQRAREIFMTGRTVKAQEAWRIGLVERVYPAASFMAEVGRYAETIAAQPPQALALAKKILNAAEDTPPCSGQIMETAAFASMFPRQGIMERIEDFFLRSIAD
ncbi:MAG: enoyl-CoA hydratase/isomerase family protein [Pelovirga sp.]